MTKRNAREKRVNSREKEGEQHIKKGDGNTRRGKEKRRSSKGVSSEYEFTGMHHIFSEHTRAVNVHISFLRLMCC